MKKIPHYAFMQYREFSGDWDIVTKNAEDYHKIYKIRLTRSDLRSGPQFYMKISILLFTEKFDTHFFKPRQC